MLGRLGGLARVRNQSPGERSRSAAKAARARWKKKGPLPKPGTMNAIVLTWLGSADGPVSKAVIVAAMNGAHGATLTTVGDALSSLRTAGHVISEPHPTSKRERLWRLA